MNAYDVISKYVAAEKRAGYQGNDKKVAVMSRHVARCCIMYGYNYNPY